MNKAQFIASLAPHFNDSKKEADLDLFKIVDTADEAVKHIVDFYSKYMLKPNF